MKARRTVLVLAVFAALMLAAGSVYAAVLTVGNASGNPGDSVQVTISVDTPDPVAGASFTIAYDNTNLHLTAVDSSFFDTFSNQWVEFGATGSPPTSVTVGGTTYTKPLITNGISGGTMIAAARVAQKTGSSPTLFTLTFAIDGNASAGDYPVQLIQSRISNTDAGYDAGGEPVPYLVGGDLNQSDLTQAFLEITVSSVTDGTITVSIADSDSDGIDDNWETTHFGNLTTANQYTDFDGDGYSDYQEYLNRNDTDPNGAAYDPKVPNAPGGSGYVAERDFDQDGHTDILWHNSSSGQLAIWLMDGPNYGSSTSPATVSDLNWQIVDTADFNQDGKTDILWRNSSSGQLAIWLMDGPYYSSSTSPATVSDLNWQIVDTADFNQDGKTDILWRNSSSGQLAIWLMDGPYYSSSTSPATVSDTNWQIQK